MSKYTTEVRFICETAAGLEESEGYANVNQIINNAIPQIFNFYFPIYDDDYKNVLCTKILKHYYTREIAFETVGLWKLNLDMTLNEIMPYYNKLYEAWAVEFNPLYDTDVTTNHTLTRGQTSEGTTWDLVSDTPQGSLQNIDNNTYLTQASKGTAENEINSTDSYLENITGKRGGASYSEMLDKYKDALINIDMMIIDDLEPLFFSLY